MGKQIYLKAKDKLALLSDLSTMLSAGIPILDAIDSLLTDAKGSSKAVLERIRSAVTNGNPLSEAFSQMPQAFDPITINIVKAAEESGTLDTSLKDIVATIEKDIAFSEQVRAGLLYPTFVMVVFGAIVILMLTFVMPRVAKVFGSLHVHLPLVTKFMIQASNFFIADWLYIIIGAFVFLSLLAVIIVTQKRAIIRMLYSLPGLSKLGDRIDLSRFSRSLSLLLHSGIPVNEALELSEKVVQKKRIITVVKLMRSNVDAGKPISQELRIHKKTLPPIMIRSLETAEESGTLEKSMQNLTEYFSNQVASSLKTITSLLEPILLVVVGVLVGGLMITIIAPMYGLISQISPGH